MYTKSTKGEKEKGKKNERKESPAYAMPLIKIKEREIAVSKQNPRPIKKGLDELLHLQSNCSTF